MLDTISITKSYHSAQQIQAGYAIERKLFQNKEYKANFKENKQRQTKNVAKHQELIPKSRFKYVKNQRDCLLLGNLFFYANKY